MVRGMEIIPVYISPSQFTTSLDICFLRISHPSILASLYTSRAKCLNIGPLCIKMIHIDLLVVVFSQKQSEERLKVRCLTNPVKLIWARCETSILAEKEQFQNRAENMCGKVWCSLWTQRWLLYPVTKSKQPTMTHEPCNSLCQERVSVAQCPIVGLIQKVWDLISHQDCYVPYLWCDKKHPSWSY